MLRSLPQLRIDGHSLLAVPAVHYRAAFAEAVNDACSQETTRPDAVAVELGPSAVFAVVKWLRELGVGPERRDPLPCMLGLMRLNNRIHPKFRQIAIRMQEVTGKHLHELAPSLLRKHLGFSAISLLCLSPTDSIVEAIRCALELGVPLYGIDLDEFASVDQVPLMIQDPLQARYKISDYAARNASFSEQGRDEAIDGRREVVMAARLKTLLRQHQRVLFTGGLAHWNSLQRLLLDPNVHPAIEVPTTCTKEYCRVLVHPVLAICQMEIFPEITAWYQRQREPANVPHNRLGDTLEWFDIFRALLNRAYQEYFAQAPKEPELGRKLEDYQNLQQFEQVLANACAVNQRLVPHIAHLLNVAEATMSRRFCQVLSSTLMEFRWASPEEWPELPVLGPDRAMEGETPCGDGTQRARMIIPQANGKGRAFHSRAIPLYITCSPGGEAHALTTKIPWCWNHEPRLEPTHGTSSVRVWPPCDFLAFGTAIQAGKIAEQTQERRVEPFEGSLLDGLDMKMTLRASIRAEDRIYVRNNPRTTTEEARRGPGLDPTVFIFAPPKAGDNASWYLYAGSMSKHHQDHVRDKFRLREVVRDKGDMLVEAVAFVEIVPVPSNLASHVVGLNLLRGTVLFGNPCLNALQEARWLEETNYFGSPIIRGSDIPGLFSMYRERHRMQLDAEDWPATLVHLAIPYVHPTRRRVVVVVPDHFVLQSVVFQEAQTRRVRVAVVPLSYFPANLIEEMTRQYLVQPEDKDGLRYSKELERLLDQSVNAHSQLLPSHYFEQAAEDRS